MMNIQKPMYLIAGGGGRNILSTFHIIKAIVRDMGKAKPTIAYVGVASLGDNWSIYLIISGLLRVICHCQVRRILIAPKNADLDKAQEALESADIVFLSGGDMEAGMKILEEKNMVGFFQELSRKGKLFVGASAGSIMLANEWGNWRNQHDESTAELFPCLGIAPVICDTHAEKDDWNELKAALQFKEVGTIAYGIISGSCLKVYPDGRLEAMNGAIARYILQNGKVERQADLLPVNYTK